MSTSTMDHLLYTEDCMHIPSVLIQGGNNLRYVMAILCGNMLDLGVYLHGIVQCNITGL